MLVVVMEKGSLGFLKFLRRSRMKSAGLFSFSAEGLGVKVLTQDEDFSGLARDDLIVLGDFSARISAAARVTWPGEEMTSFEPLRESRNA